MSVLFITPDYPSHYLPLIPIGHTLKAADEEVFFATGSCLAARIQKDGFKHIELVLGARSNPDFMRLAQQSAGENECLASIIEVSQQGMIATLKHQAKGRLNDLFWKPHKVAERIRDILAKIKPRYIICVQLSYNAIAALIAFKVPFASFITGHPAQLPTQEEVYGYPYFRPTRFHAEAEKLSELKKICMEAQDSFTKGFNQVIQQFNPDATPVTNALAVSSPYLMLFNYPEELGMYRRCVLPKHAYFIGSSVRREFLDSALEEWLQTASPYLPTVYVSFGSVFSARSDVLGRIVQALRPEALRVILACGVSNPSDWGTIPSHWLVRSFFPQVAVLPHCDLVICHGGNNTITEALTAGVPLLVAPFSSDQFFEAVDIERYNLGAVFDPNISSTDEIRQLVYYALKAQKRTVALGVKLRSQPGHKRASYLCQGMSNLYK